MGRITGDKLSLLSDSKAVKKSPVDVYSCACMDLLGVSGSCSVVPIRIDSVQPRVSDNSMALNKSENLMSPAANLQLVPVKKTALVVGSNPVLRDKISKSLPDWAIHTVSNNFAAVAAVEMRPFDLVITNENTSGRADVELLRKLRMLRP